MASRSPVPGVGYDQSLLAAAPEITKADKQEGYNPDLLEQGTPARAPTSRRTPVALPTNGKYHGSDESNGIRKAGLPAAAPAPTDNGGKVRQRKLMWIIAGVVLLVIIAIAVGVGVGVGTKKKGNSSNNGNGIPIPGGVTPSSNTSPTKSDTAGQATPTKTDTTGQTASQGGISQGIADPTGAAVTDGAISPSAATGGANGGVVPSTTQRFTTDVNGNLINTGGKL